MRMELSLGGVGCGVGRGPEPEGRLRRGWVPRLCARCRVSVDDRRVEFYEFGFLVYCSTQCLLDEHPWLREVDRLRVRRARLAESEGEG